MAGSASCSAVGERPLVVVCLAAADLRPEVDPLTASVHADSRRSDLSLPDAAALEHGLRMAGAWDAAAAAVAVGPVEIDAVLASASALGADPLRVECGAHSTPEGPHALHPAEVAGDPEVVAAALAAAIRSLGEASVVVCGDRAPWHGTGAVPALLAHHLGFAQALGLVHLEADSSPSTLRAKRRLDGGWRESLEVRLPAVVSVEAAGIRLRRAALAASLAAAGRAAPVFRAAGAGRSALTFGAPVPYRPRARPVPAPSGAVRERLMALTGALAEREPARIVGPLGAADAAGELLAYLERGGYR